MRGLTILIILIKIVTMTNKSIPATQAKTAFAEMIDAARKEPVTITRNNRPVAIVISPEEYERFEMLDDAYWGERAKEAGEGGYLDVNESEQFLRTGFDAKN